MFSVAGVAAQQLVPSMVDFLLYAQSVSQGGMLSLDYPEFYTRITSKFGFTNFIPYIDAVNKLVGGETNNVSSLPDPLNRVGLGRFSSSVGIAPRKLLLYATVIFALIIAIWTALVLFVIGCIELYFYVKKNSLKSGYKESLFYFWIGNVLRIFYLAFFILISVSVYQLTITDSSVDLVIKTR